MAEVCISGYMLISHSGVQSALSLSLRYGMTFLQFSACQRSKFTADLLSIYII